MRRLTLCFLLIIGIVGTVVLAVDLGYFLLTDGITLWGENRRGNDAFYNHWTTRLPFLLVAALMWGSVNRLLPFAKVSKDGPTSQSPPRP